MFIGRFAARFAAKGAGPGVSLGARMAASRLLDLLWPAFATSCRRNFRKSLEGVPDLESTIGVLRNPT
jgi:hypothetical protein